MNNKIVPNEFTNNVDLMFLTNPNNLSNVKDLSDKFDFKDVEKYKKYINATIKKLLSNKFISNDINDCFEIFLKKLIDHKKFSNRKKLIQKQYEGMDENKNNKEFVSIDISNIDISIMNIDEKKKIDLNSFIVKKKNKKNKKKMILPKKKEFFE